MLIPRTPSSGCDCDNDSAATRTEFWRDPSLDFVESRRACHSRACYRPHSHPTFSIGAVDAGGSLFTGASGGPCSLKPGMMVFIPAGAVHSCNPLPHKQWSYQMLHMDAAWLNALLAEMDDVSGGFISQGEVRVTNNQECYHRFCELNNLLFSIASTEDKNTALIEFIGDSKYGTGPVKAFPVMASDISRALHNVIEVLQHAEKQPWALSELASLSGMSRYQLIRAFRAATGMTPHAYQLNLCINKARHWLQSGCDITDIAYRLGFADQSHFQRVFKAHTGVTPGCYRT
ncbi:AraC family transcriptional regulator [Pantoea sp. VS1]|uniref:AraC family transcriptional regulator n=1 Tax=Pantoea sp. VS1 TaxID=2003658 RepID=UPI000B50E25E|nr:AraC family transcriptional regulator [Pantoea sp. VS1]OWS74386.1 AraC family transcriptional regulator [Pantoea sp. VS1]